MSDSVEIQKDLDEYLEFLDTLDELIDIDLYEWNFPRTKFLIGENSSERRRQLMKVSEEVCEAFSAIEHEEDLKQLHEIMDIICACETLLRSYPWFEVDEAYREVLRKNFVRHYWAETKNHDHRRFEPKFFDSDDYRSLFFANPATGQGGDLDGDTVILR